MVRGKQWTEGTEWRYVARFVVGIARRVRRICSHCNLIKIPTFHLALHTGARAA